MDVQQVDGVEAQSVAALPRGRGRVVGAGVVRVEFGRDDDVVAVDAARAREGVRQRLADERLVVVHLRRVDVAVAGVESRLYGRDTLVAVGHAVGAEADVGEFERHCRTMRVIGRESCGS